jgi:hypothetical protein
MSLYPHLSQHDHRRCSYKEDIFCPSFPCPHTECHDTDWLDHSEERLANQAINEKAWDLYYSLYGKTPSSILNYKSLYGKTPSSILKDQLSVEEWAFYEPKVERCRRLEGKWDQIFEETKASTARSLAQCMREQEEVLNDPALQDSPVVIACKASIRTAKLEGRTRLPGKEFWFRDLRLNE